MAGPRVPPDAMARGFDPADPGEAAFAAWLGEALLQADPGRLERGLRARLLVGHAAVVAGAGAVAPGPAIDQELVAARVAAAARDADARVAAAMRDADARVAAACKKDVDVAETRAAMTVLSERVRQLADAASTAEVRRLDAALASARAELERLRASNHVKGAAGEAAVMHALRESDAFAGWAFEDTSARGAHSDFHMTSPDGARVVAFEVKNKAVVTAGDVEKSARDILELGERLGERLAAYVFASVRTRNVPGRGALRVERVGRVPVLWFGADAIGADGAATGDGGALRELVRATQLLLDVSDELRAERAAGADGAAAVARMLACLNAHLARLDALRRTAASVQDAAASVRRHAAQLGAEVDAMYRAVAALVRGRAAECDAAAEADPGDAQHAAPATIVLPPAPLRAPCGRVFASPHAVAGHQARCDACRHARGGGRAANGERQ